MGEDFESGPETLFSKCCLSDSAPPKAQLDWNCSRNRNRRAAYLIAVPRAWQMMLPAGECPLPAHPPPPFYLPPVHTHKCCSHFHAAIVAYGLFLTGWRTDRLTLAKWLRKSSLVKRAWMGGSAPREHGEPSEPNWTELSRTDCVNGVIKRFFIASCRRWNVFVLCVTF